MAGTFEFSIIIGLSFLIQFNTHLYLALAARALATAARAAVTAFSWLAAIAAIFIVMVIHNSTSWVLLYLSSINRSVFLCNLRWQL